MKFICEHPDSSREAGEFEGENMTLGLGGTLHACVCGARQFVDPYSDLPPEERDPDRICPTCGRKFWYFDDEHDRTGFLH